MLLLATGAPQMLPVSAAEPACTAGRGTWLQLMLKLLAQQLGSGGAAN